MEEFVIDYSLKPGDRSVIKTVRGGSYGLKDTHSDRRAVRNVSWPLSLLWFHERYRVVVFHVS